MKRRRPQPLFERRIGLRDGDGVLRLAKRDVGAIRAPIGGGEKPNLLYINAQRLAVVVGAFQNILPSKDELAHMPLLEFSADNCRTKMQLHQAPTIHLYVSFFNVLKSS
jgi:hypothetical protein